MPLRSQLLRDDQALQRCLVSDPAHVIPGARGPHVARIQTALKWIEQPEIAVGELRGQTYGPTTAAAVLAFKNKRRIINPAYQRTADNIVGKMTIARLDEEVARLEAIITPGRSRCGGGAGGGGGNPLFEEVRLGIGERRPALRNLGATVNVIIQVTETAEKLGRSLNFAQALVDRAAALMAPHGLRFAPGGLLAMFGRTIPDPDQVLSGSNVSCCSMRASGEKETPGMDSLRIIICPFAESDTVFGVTDSGSFGGKAFPKFCLINARKENPDHGTLLHEMIHAAKPEFLQHDGDAASVFAEGVARTQLPAKHAESIANAFFSLRRL